MPIRRPASIGLALALMSVGVASMDARAQQTGAVPPALGEPARQALDRAHDEVASAVAILSGLGMRDQEQALIAAHRDVLDARGAMEQAITAAKADGTALDTATDRLHRAIDKISEVARSLRQLNPPVPPASLEAARSHLEEAADDIAAAAGRLTPGAAVKPPSS